ncbi:hypothetical protein MMC17_005974 [Xylographa soralifera]|nr:hypothetical protein [Xylographa soralifera]
MDDEAHYRAIRVAQANNIVVGCGINPDHRPEAQPIIYPRHEIDRFIEDVDTCNLFLLALAELQSLKGDADNFSYFSMSAIHGRPAGPWADVTPAVASQNTDPAAVFTPTAENPAPPVEAVAVKQPGYCAHSSILFPTWHRPYLGMFEQSIYLKMRDIALKYPEAGGLRNNYIEAAKRFRLPYWDPLLLRFLPSAGDVKPWHCGLPKVLSAGRVFVRTPTDPNMLTEINNPLYCYKFSPKYAYDNKPPFEWKSFWNIPKKRPIKLKVTPNQFTIRGPDLNGSPNNRRVTVNSSQVQIERRSGVPQYLTQQGARIESLFIAERLPETTPSDAYGMFATNIYYLNARTGRENRAFKNNDGNSIEGFHGAVHGIIGRGEHRESDTNKGIEAYSLIGHMGEVPYSSFDPIFWLHHWYAHSSVRPEKRKFTLILWPSNIDRLIAIWQRMNPDAWDFSAFLFEPNFVEPYGLRQTPTTPLFPFRRLGNKFWDSNACRDPESLGYKYHDYLIADGDTADQIKPKIRRFYGWLFQMGDRTVPDQAITGYPRNTTLAECLTSTVFIDSRVPAPLPDFPGEVRAPFRRRGLAHVAPKPTDAEPPVLESSVLNTLAPTASTEVKPAPVGLVAIPPSSTGSASSAAAVSSITRQTTTDSMARTLDAVTKDSVPKDGRSPIRYKLPARPIAPRNIRKPNLVTSNPAESHVVKNGKLRYWECLVRFEKFTVGGSFDVLFFIGDFAPSTGKWFRDKNMVGTVFNWANADLEACPNCRVQATGGLVVADQIQLTHSLLDYITSGQLVHGSRLESLEPEAVVPFLTRNLHWRILDNVGKEHQREDIGGLKVQVMERLVSLPLLEGDEAVYEDYTVWADVTHGRPGGVNRGEEA